MVPPGGRGGCHVPSWAARNPAGISAAMLRTTTRNRRRRIGNPFPTLLTLVNGFENRLGWFAGKVNSCRSATSENVGILKGVDPVNAGQRASSPHGAR
jgi:hypothetical protein